MQWQHFKAASNIHLGTGRVSVLVFPASLISCAAVIPDLQFADQPFCKWKLTLVARASQSLGNWLLCLGRHLQSQKGEIKKFQVYGSSLFFVQMLLMNSVISELWESQAESKAWILCIVCDQPFQAADISVCCTCFSKHR